jgi:ATP-dependent DNA helicase RecQ
MKIDSDLKKNIEILSLGSTNSKKIAIFFIVNNLKAGDVLALEPLIGALHNGDYYIRLKAAKGLGIVKDARALEPLHLALKDKIIDVRIEAEKALRNIEGSGLPNHAAENNKINIRELKIGAQGLMKLWDENNKKVGEAKKQRDEYNEKANQLYAKIDAIRKVYNLTGERSIKDLHREIDHLEFRQQTEVLPPNKERQLSDRIAALNAELRSRKEQLEKNEELRKLLDAAQVMRDQASGYHEQVTKFAELAQEYHDQMIAIFNSKNHRYEDGDAKTQEISSSIQSANAESNLVQSSKGPQERLFNNSVLSSTEPASSKIGTELLRKALNNPSAQFREGQWETIEEIVQNRARILVIQRTGWGKSIVYFLATRMLRLQGAGPTLLISPLRSLMRNQIQAANGLGINAYTINSDNPDDWETVKARLQSGDVDILLVAPERLENDEFREHYLLPIAGTIGLFVVDEAHCISDWGHDFRPDFRRIARILQALPRNIPILATTATANNRVIQDIMDQLGTDLQVVRGPLARDSLCLQNIRLPRQVDRLAWLANVLPSLPGSGIVYVLTRKHANLVAKWLKKQGIEAYPYYSSIGKKENSMNEELEQKLLDNQIKVLVSTPALGMGFDKPDLGFVIHFQRPGSVVHYYQQVGRAGRAIDKAYGVLLSGEEDPVITEYFIRNAFPPEAHVKQVLDALASAGDDGLSIPMLEQKVNLPRGQIKSVLKLLAVDTPSPIIKERNRWHATSAEYVRDRVKIDKLTEIRHKEQSIMDDYIGSSTCLMRFLQKELDDKDSVQCGRCAVCIGSPILSDTFSSDLVEKADSFLRQNEIIIHPRKKWPNGDALAIYNWRGGIPEGLRSWKGRALLAWGDSRWGELVKIGKQNGHFDDELVCGAVEMVRERWKPIPMPTWITCIPSLTKPTLVSDFARRLADALRIPFMPCVRKVRATEPQKMMRNSYQQARNLAGAFKIDDSYRLNEPLFLVDDMVDSRWTFTIVAALLKTAGTGPVFPLALADTSQGDEL